MATARRPRKLTEKQKVARRARLNALMADLMDELGGEATPDKMYDYELQTPAGILRISGADKYSDGSGIHTRFDEPERATRAYERNTYSGKWNFYGDSPEEVFEEFSRRLHQIMEG